MARAVVLQLINAEIALEESGPDALRGYGAVAPEGATAVEAAAADLHRQLESIVGLLEEAADESGAPRLKPLEATSEDPRLLAELAGVVDNRRHDVVVGELEPGVRGTRVRAEVDPEDAPDLAVASGEHTDDFTFGRTRTIVRLFAVGTELLSRSEAKRLVRGLERFREVVIDFGGVRLVGQDFVGELFRVWSSAHPEVRLIPVGMSEPVAFVVERAHGAGAAGREG